MTAARAPDSRAATEYLAKLNKVPGWFQRCDGLVFAEISAVQARAGVGGDLLEIGAYHGRSAILMGHLLRESERLFVCDTFEDQPPVKPPGNRRWIDGKRHYPGLSQSAFEENYRRHHCDSPVIIRGPSSTLLDRGLARPPFRIVHVDGSHEPQVMLQDIDTASTLLSGGGVVIFEDDHRLHNPGVAPAVLDALERGSLQPLCMTPVKLYATVGADAHGLRAALSAWAAAGSEFEPAVRPFANRDILLLYPMPHRRGPWRALDRKAGLGDQGLSLTVP